MNEHRAIQGQNASHSPMERPNWLQEGVAYLNYLDSKEQGSKRTVSTGPNNGIRIS